MKHERKILHIDMDAFFASVEQAVNPRLKGKPLIVGGRADKRRSVVCAASYEAKRLGIDSGMSTQEAFRICPYAEFVAADSAKYLYVSKQIGNLLHNYSPQVEQASVDEFYLDVSGLDKSYGSYLELGMDIKNNIKSSFDITGSIGISVNRLMSKIASSLKKPDGMVIMDIGDIACFLKDLPVEKIPGIGRHLTERLNNYSIFSYSDMRRIPEDFYADKFGKVGLWMFAAANPSLFMEDDIHWFHEVDAAPKSVGHSYTLPRNIYARHEVEAWLRLLCEMVGSRLRRYKLESSILHIYLRKPGLEFVSKEKNFKEFTNDSAALFLRALFILDKLKARNIQIRALGVTARGLGAYTGSFLFADQKKRKQLSNAQDDINQRYGDWTLHPASILSIRE
ncbi:MAG: DNA polymerase IV [Candidatus Omnitrophica bacterium]|nr:DNA polymerase IV [Candidatus Omnitrophota bacterium]